MDPRSRERVFKWQRQGSRLVEKLSVLHLAADSITLRGSRESSVSHGTKGYVWSDQYQENCYHSKAEVTKVEADSFTLRYVDPSEEFVEWVKQNIERTVAPPLRTMPLLFKAMNRVGDKVDERLRAREGYRTVWGLDEFPWAHKFKERSAELQAEAKGLLDTYGPLGMSSAFPNGGAKNKDAWRVYEVSRNDKRCPAAFEVLNSLPGLLGGASFSFLMPGQKIILHKNDSFARWMWRIHFGLVVPEGDCALSVDGQIVRWAAGEGFVFDDSVFHEAWNHTNAVRVVFMVDLVRPMPPFDAFCGRYLRETEIFYNRARGYLKNRGKGRRGSKETEFRKQLDEFDEARASPQKGPADEKKAG
jgi:beta-hydroxylase